MPERSHAILEDINRKDQLGRAPSTQAIHYYGKVPQQAMQRFFESEETQIKTNRPVHKNLLVVYLKL